MLLAKYVETADFTGMSEALKIGGWGSKGQLISEGLCGVFKSPKKRTKES